MTLHRTYRALLSAAAVALMAATLSSCSSGGEDEPQAEAVYHLGFTLSVGEIDNGTQSADLSDGSRAPSDGLYHPGEGLENFIDINNLSTMRLALYNVDTNALITEIKDFAISPLATEGTAPSKRYYLAATTKADISSGRFKILLLANWPSYPAELTLSEVWAQKFDYSSPLPTLTSPIPLFGIKAVGVPGGLRRGETVDIGTIHLLRALAKIEVIINNDTDKNWTLKRLALTSHNNKGFCAPTGIDNQNQYVTGSWNTDYVGFVSIPEDASDSGVLDFEPAGENRYLLYVPEYRNYGDGTTLSEIIVSFYESAVPEERRVAVRGTNAQPLDFHRNVWYRITLSKKDENTELNFTVDVIPYSVRELNPIFGLDVTDVRPSF